MDLLAIGLGDVSVFEHDPKSSAKTTLKWMLGQLVFTALMPLCFRLPTGLEIFTLAILISLSLFCAFMAVVTIARRRAVRIEIEGKFVREYYGGRHVKTWDLTMASKLNSFRFAKGPGDDLWIVKYDDVSQHLILKRHWLDFDQMLKLIEKGSGMKFTEDSPWAISKDDQ